MIKEPIIDELVARKFLLGQLSPEEQGQIEELAFEDPDTFTLLESVEEDLVDEFLRGELSPLERQRFKDYFLSLPGRRQNLQISEVLQEHFNPPKKEEVIAVEQEEVNDERNYSLLGGFLDLFTVQSAWARTITASVSVALLLVTVWLSLREKQPDPIQAGPNPPVNVPSPAPQISPSIHPSPSPVQAQNKRRSRTPQKQKPEPAPDQEPVATYVNLIPSAVLRGGQAPPLPLPPDASSIPVGLVLLDPRNFKTYDAALHDEAGKELDNWHDLKAQKLPTTQGLPASKGLVIDVQTNSLKPDEFYRIRVTAVSSKGERINLKGYSFEAKK